MTIIIIYFSWHRINNSGLDLILLYSQCLLNQIMLNIERFSLCNDSILFPSQACIQLLLCVSTKNVSDADYYLYVLLKILSVMAKVNIHTILVNQWRQYMSQFNKLMQCLQPGFVIQIRQHREILFHTLIPIATFSIRSNNSPSRKRNVLAEKQLRYCISGLLILQHQFEVDGLPARGYILLASPIGV